MSEFRRRMMVRASKPYINMVGKYVDTGVTVTGDIRFEMKVRFFLLSNYQSILGRYGDNWWGMGVYAGIEDKFGGSKIVIPEQDFKAGDVITLVKDRNKTYVDGVLKVEHPYKQFERDYSLMICNERSGVDGDVYSFAIWQDDTLIDEYYPFVVDGKEYFKGKNTGKLLEILTINK